MKLKPRNGAAQQRDRPLVLFAMEYVPKYRAPFYPLLKQRLSEDGIDLAISYGDPPASRQGRNDAGVIDFGDFRPNRFMHLRGREITMQAVPRQLKNADLVISQQEAGLTLNYLLALRSLRGHRLAFWGHGQDPNETTRSGPIEQIKRRLVQRSSWVFAYTTRSQRVFESLGMPSGRITVTNNALPPTLATGAVSSDVSELVAGFEQRSSRVGWLASSFDEGKRLDFLFEALEGVRSRMNESFEFVFMGDGSSGEGVRDFCAERSWAHYLGARHGADKAYVAHASHVMVMPGAVGLHVLDSFVHGTPLIASAEPSNSHELDYVKNDVNGIVLDRGASTSDYAASISALLSDSDRLDRLSEGARSSHGFYTMENMVDNFATGIVAALAAEPR